MKKKSLGTLIFYVLIILGAFLYIGSITGSNIFTNGNITKITYNELVADIQNDQIASIEISMGKNETAYVQAKLTEQKSGNDQYVTAYVPIAEFNAMVDAYLADNPGSIDVTYGMLSEEIWSTILMIVMMIAVIGFVFFIFMSQ